MRQAYKLHIEIGRYHKKAEAERKCLVCDKNEVENETHFLVECPLYVEERSKYLNEVHIKYHSTRQLRGENLFIWIMMNEDTNLVRHMGRFIYESFQKRESATNDKGH